MRKIMKSSFICLVFLSLLSPSCSGNRGSSDRLLAYVAPELWILKERNEYSWYEWGQNQNFPLHKDASGKPDLWFFVRTDPALGTFYQLPGSTPDKSSALYLRGTQMWSRVESEQVWSEWTSCNPSDWQVLADEGYNNYFESIGSFAEAFLEARYLEQKAAVEMCHRIAAKQPNSPISSSYFIEALRLQQNYNWLPPAFHNDPYTVADDIPRFLEYDSDTLHVLKALDNLRVHYIMITPKPGVQIPVDINLAAQFAPSFIDPSHPSSMGRRPEALSSFWEWAATGPDGSPIYVRLIINSALVQGPDPGDRKEVLARMMWTWRASDSDEWAGITGAN